MMSLKHFKSLSLALLFLISAIGAHAVTLYDQIKECRSKLEASKLPPAGNCFDSTNTEPFGTSSRLGYFRVNDAVDAVFHCDNLDEHNSFTGSNTDVEMIVHNRSTGGTCFFRIPQGSVSLLGDFPSLEDCKSNSCSSPWQIGDNLVENGQCTDCHRHGGPYFVEKSVDAMAKFGLINNQHDTNFKKYHLIHADKTRQDAMQARVNQSNPAVGGLDSCGPSADPAKMIPDCGGSCHSFEHCPSKFAPAFPADSAVNLLKTGVMPPTDQASPYRWVNLDGPSGSGDYERYSKMKEVYPELASSCKNPTYIEAHVVGSDAVLRSDSNWAKLRSFNPVDGLVCKNLDFSGGCLDFGVRFQCSDGSWTGWIDKDDPDGTGDHEYPPSTCKSPKAIQARYFPPNPSDPNYFVMVEGFPDRLEQFDKDALICKDADQADGTCANYVVRFRCD